MSIIVLDNIINLWWKSFFLVKQRPEKENRSEMIYVCVYVSHLTFVYMRVRVSVGVKTLLKHKIKSSLVCAHFEVMAEEDAENFI